MQKFLKLENCLLEEYDYENYKNLCFIERLLANLRKHRVILKRR